MTRRDRALVPTLPGHVKFVQQGSRKGLCVSDVRKIIPRSCGRAKAWHVCTKKRIDNRFFVIAHCERDAVVVGCIEIEFAQILVDVVFSRPLGEDLTSRRRRDQACCNILLRNGVYLRGIDDGASCACCIGLKDRMRLKKCSYAWVCIWAVSQSPSAGEISTELSGGISRDEPLILSCRLALSLVTREEEEPVFAIDQMGYRNRAANRAAKLVALQDRARIAQFVVEKIAGIECVVANIVIQAAVQRVRARLDDLRDRAAPIAAVFSRVVVFQETELFHSFRVRIEDYLIAGYSIIEPAIEQITDCVAASPRHTDASEPVRPSIACAVRSQVVGDRNHAGLRQG